MNTLHRTISWFEIPVTEMARAMRFYEILLQVELREMALGNDLVMAFFPVSEHATGGALCQHKQYYKPGEEGVTIYFDANPDIETMLERVKQANGTILMDKKMISPDAGYMAMFRDTEGNRIALYEHKKTN